MIIRTLYIVCEEKTCETKAEPDSYGINHEESSGGLLLRSDLQIASKAWILQQQQQPLNYIALIATRAFV